MFLIKNGYLYSKGVKFKLPVGFFINTNEEMDYLDGIEYISPDRKIVFGFSFISSYESAKDIVEGIYEKDTGFTCTKPATFTAYNGLSGYAYSFKGDRYQQFGIVFELAQENDKFCCFEFNAGTHDMDIDLESNADVQFLLNSIAKA